MRLSSRQVDTEVYNLQAEVVKLENDGLASETGGKQKGVVPKESSEKMVAKRRRVNCINHM